MSSEIPTRLAVRWRDLDCLGHVNSVVFLTYLEEGRSAWLDKMLGPPFEADQYVVARIELDYMKEIPAGTEYVETRHRLLEVGTSSITFGESICLPNGTTTAVGRVVVVMWEPAQHRSRPISPDERVALTDLLAANDDAAE